MSDSDGDSPPEEEPIPKLPRAPLRGKLSMASIIRIGMFATLLYAVIAMRRPCADGAGRFISGFDDIADAAPTPETVTGESHYPGFELITAEEALKRWPDSPTATPVIDAGIDAGIDAKILPKGHPAQD